jgi:hypothetical protein
MSRTKSPSAALALKLSPSGDDGVRRASTKAAFTEKHRLTAEDLDGPWWATERDFGGRLLV